MTDDQTERLIKALERLAAAAERAPFNTIPAPLPFSTQADRCSVCGGLWKDMTHYVCTNHSCPRGTTCTFQATKGG